MRRKVLLFVAAISLLAGACGNAAAPAQTAESSQVRSEAVSESPAASSSTAVSSAGAEAAAAVTPTETPEPEPAYLKERAGRYYLGNLIQADKRMTLEEIAEVEGYGIEMQLDLQEDGTGTMMVFGEKWDFTWDEQCLQFEKENSDYVWTKKNGISFKKDGASYLFTTQKASDIIKAKEADAEAEKQAKEEAKKEEAKEEKKQEEQKKVEEAESDIAYAVMTGADWVTLSDSDVTGLCIWYEYTNKTDKYLSPYAFRAEIEQDDAVTEEGTVSLSAEEEIPENDYRYTEVQPGSTSRSIHLFSANPDGGTIRYTLKDENGVIMISEELDPADLPGRPEEEFIPEEIIDLSYMEELPAKGVYNDSYELSIKKSAEIVSSAADGGKMLRVKFSLTNNSSETVSPYMVVYLRAVQDGISLNPGWSSADDPDLQLIYEDVPPGEKATFYYEWHLISDSPVAVEAYDWFDGKAVLGRAYNLSEL